MKDYQLGLYEKAMPGSLSLGEKLNHAKEAGFDYMEISIDESDEKLARLSWGSTEINALRHGMEEREVPILSMCLSAHRRFPFGDPDAAVRRRSLQIMENAIRLSSRLGIRIIQLAGYDVYYKSSDSSTRAFFSENLHNAVLLAARAGLILAFETMETPFLDTVSKAMQWIQKEGSPYLQVYPDIGNLTNASKVYETDVLDDLESGRSHIAAMHLKETTPGVYREVPYGAGHVDFGAACKKAYDLGVRMFVGEFWHCGEPDWRDILTANNAFLRNKIEYR
jgi:predicted hexulose-6-phosphate isomerase